MQGMAVHRREHAREEVDVLIFGLLAVFQELFALRSIRCPEHQHPDQCDS